MKHLLTSLLKVRKRINGRNKKENEEHRSNNQSDKRTPTSIAAHMPGTGTWLEVLIRKMTIDWVINKTQKLFSGFHGDEPCLNGWLQKWEATFKLSMWRVLVLPRPCWGTVWSSACWHWPNQYQNTSQMINSADSLKLVSESVPCPCFIYWFRCRLFHRIVDIEAT